MGVQQLDGSDALVTVAAVLSVPDPIGEGRVYLRYEPRTANWNEAGDWLDLTDDINGVRNGYPHAVDDIAILANYGWIRATRDACARDKRFGRIELDSEVFRTIQPHATNARPDVFPLRIRLHSGGVVVHAGQHPRRDHGRADHRAGCRGGGRDVVAANRFSGADPRSLLEGLRGEIRAFVGPAAQFDDIALLAVTYRGPEAAV